MTTIEEISVSPDVSSEQILTEYKTLLRDAQGSGKKWIEVTPKMMAVALKEVSLAIGADAGDAKSFIQNDVRVYMEGHKDSLDKSDNSIAGC